MNLWNFAIGSMAAIGTILAGAELSLAAPLDGSLAAKTPHTGRQNNRKNYNQNSAQQKAQRAAKQRQEREAAAARLKRAQQLAASASQAAGAAQFKLQAAAGKVVSAKGSLDTSKDAGDSATDELRQIEQQIEDSQPDDSPYAKAHKEADEAAEKFIALRDKIEGSPDYRAAKKEALAGENKSEKLSEMEQRFFIANPDYILARSTFELMGSRLSEIRTTLYAQDPRWLDAAQRSKLARGQAAEAKKQLQGSLLKKADAADDAREAAAAANAAQNLLKLREAQAKAAGAPKNGNSKNSKPSSGSKK